MAVVNGEVTVSDLRSSRDQFWLEAANPDCPPIEPAGSLEILGVVVGSVRR